MAFEKNNGFDLEKIQKRYKISKKKIENLPIEIKELNKIYQNFESSKSDIEKMRAEILAVLNEGLTSEVHSIRCRIKDSDHLIEKIIRNLYSNPDKYSHISDDNYYKIITDLIGVRIIILDKKDWIAVHKSLLEIFQNIPERYVSVPNDILDNYDKYSGEANTKRKELENSYHAEKPVVYITSGEDRDSYKDEYLRVDNSKSHYRSIHYIIRYKKVYFEIQVRTFFEEGWLEFDHRIKYPYDHGNKKKQEFAGVLSNLAIAADRLIAFYDEADFYLESTDDTDEMAIISEEEDNSLDGKSFDDKIKRLF